jgi:uncharacterized damage-inducible protein DinB
VGPLRGIQGKINPDLQTSRWISIWRSVFTEGKEVSEISTYQQRIKDLNTQVCDFVRDIPAEGLNWRPPFKDVNSLAALASHIAGGQLSWIVEIIGHQVITRDREQEFEIIVSDAKELVDNITGIFEKVEGVLANLTDADLDEICQAQDLLVPVRWGIVHIIDHTALHFGQMQLMFQFWSNGESKPSPYWHQRFQSS